MIDIKDLIKSRYAQDSDFKKIFDMPDSISCLLYTSDAADES